MENRKKTRAGVRVEKRSYKQANTTAYQHKLKRETKKQEKYIKKTPWTQEEE